MRCELCAIEEMPEVTFCVVFSRYRGGWLFSRHKDRDTWETQGGHVEQNETIEEAAARELYEESGAIPCQLTPLCGYWAARDGHERSYGAVFLAEIDHLDALPPDSEMAEVQWFNALPEAVTYPAITPLLYARALQFLRKREDAP